MRTRYLFLVLVSLVSLVLAAAPAFACGIEGTVTWSDGSKSHKTTTVSTSWNSKKAYPDKGRYALELGPDACGKSMTVYLDGNQGKQVTLPGSGNARVDFIAR
jgi:hypothetical protein